MEKKGYLKKIARMVNVVVIIAIYTMNYAVLWYNFYNESMDEPLQFVRRGHWLIILLYIVLLYICLVLFGALKIGYLKPGELVYAQILAIISVNALTYIEICLISRRIVEVGPIAILVFVDLFIGIMWTIYATAINHRLNVPKKLLMVYGSKLANELLFKMSARYDRYKICQALNVSTDLGEILETSMKYDGVIICDVPAQIRNDILKFCYEQKKRAYVTPKISDIIVRSASNIELFDTPILYCENNTLGLRQRFVKRILDIVISLLAIIFFSPMMLVIAIAIKLEDRGPIFFKQDRATIDEKEFEIYKFRSMIVDAEKDNKVIPATDKDPRITKVGNIIRFIRMDELPQLFNILKGDMSVVGPRPERLEHVEEYTKTIPEFKYRLRVKGGLTGYAQIYGKYNTTAYDKLRLDLMYIQNYSILLDIRLIIATVKILFVKESTEGFKLEEEE